jgi:hypothetical protein
VEKEKGRKTSRYPVVKANCIAEKKTDFGSFLSKLAKLLSQRVIHFSSSS